MLPAPSLPLAAPVVSLAVRWLHVLAAAVALGGAVLLWAALRRSAGIAGTAPSDAASSASAASAASAASTASAASAAPDRFDSETCLAAATAYEWLFWVAAGVLVMTGVGNLGAYAPALPGGRWSATLALKLAAVVLVLVGSAVRSLLVVRWRASPAGVRVRTLRRGYGATALALAAVVALAEVLAHG